MADAGGREAEVFGDLGALKLRSRRVGDTHTIALAGEFDLSSVEAVERELELVGRTDTPAIVLDLSQLEFIDSSGLRVIVMAHRHAADRLSIVRGPERVHRVFEMCDMVKLLPFVDEHPDRESGDRPAVPPPIQAVVDAGGTGDPLIDTLIPAA